MDQIRFPSPHSVVPRDKGKSAVDAVEKDDAVDAASAAVAALPTVAAQAGSNAEDLVKGPGSASLHH